MNELERYITENRAGFDSDEPAPGHFHRFEQKLDSMHPQRGVLPGRSHLLKIAATILLVVTAGALAIDLSSHLLRDRFAVAGGEGDLPLEIREAMQYYDSRAAEQVKTLNRLSAGISGTGDAGKAADGQLRALDASTVELRRSLSADPGNEQILDAIVRNQQMKETVLNTLITSLTQIKYK